MALRILVLGSGGREHALAWKLSQSPLVEQILVCPGNGGTSQVPKTKNIKSPSSNFHDLVQLALAEQVYH
jgi:phosphoribosylamine--glycine ligase / phosphoribosylformylglycinamidine cyclo-ligase